MGMEALKKVGKNLLGNTDKACISIRGAEEEMGMFTVQYNPSSISIQAIAKNSTLQTMQNDAQAGAYIQQNTFPTSTVMYVDLIFDKVNNFDAFTSEKYKLSTSMLAAGAMKLASLNGGRYDNYSVTPFVNAFIGILFDERVKSVTFSWNKMSFTGILISVDSQMTMFSPSGHAIRANFRLGIKQNESDNKANEYWDNAFDDMFGEMYDDSETNGGSMADQLGSILNLGLF